MENNHKYLNQCPSIHDYESMLNGSGDESFQLDFHKHLDECELCSAAYSGYLSVGITSASKHLQTKVNFDTKKNPLRLLAYAATIALMVGSYFYFQNVANNTITAEPLFVSDAYTEYEELNTGAKKLMAKNQEDYWHINAKGELRLNDQVIQMNEIDGAKLEYGGKAFVELETNNGSLLNPLMEKLKVDKKQKVFTLSKNRSLSPITRLGANS